MPAKTQHFTQFCPWGIAGQKMYFATSPELAASPPADLPQCASSCMYNFGAFQPGYVAQRWGNTGYSI